MLKIIKKLIRPLLSKEAILKTHELRGKLAARLYRYPGKELTVIGVTGTNGKTTTCHFIASVLEAAGHKVAMATTIDFKIGDTVHVNKIKMTTPSPFLVQKFLREAVKAECRYVVLEVTAHALAQYRVWGIDFPIVVLTNVTHDHLDYFETFDKYRQAKEQLFANNPKVSVLNVDDPSAPYFLHKPAETILTYAIDNRADFIARKVLHSPDSVTFTLVTPEGQLPLTLRIPGRFNVYNALAAVAVAHSQKVNLQAIVEGLENVEGVAGRMETVNKGQGFTVLVDYAHAPDALQKAYETVKQGARGRIIAVLGACGDRDKIKRPILGELAARYADYVIVTNEDPYTEDPHAIIDQVISGIPKGRKQKPRYRKSQFKMFKTKTTGEGEWWWNIFDRREAIAKALSLAQRGDVVIITGKGAEEVMVVGDKHIPWSDRKVVEEELDKLLKSTISKPISLDTPTQS